MTGRKIIITRSRTQASSLKKALSSLGANVIEFPTIDIQPVTDFSDLDNTINIIDSFSWIIFTSVNSVEIFMKRMLLLDIDPGALANNKIAVIGKETGNVLKKYGIIPDLMPERSISEGLIETFINAETNFAGKKILMPGSAIARDFIPNELKKMGADVSCFQVYNNIIPAYTKDQIESIFTEDIDLVTFTSSSTVTNLVEILKNVGLDNYIQDIKGASIGPITSGTAAKLGVPIVIEAKTHTIPVFVETIEKYFSNKQE